MNLNVTFEPDNYGAYKLHRYPVYPKETLFAWDAADYYLLNVLREHLESDLKVLIVNDNFGALSVALSDYKPSCYTDSWMSAQAVQSNLETNGISTDQFSCYYSLAELVEAKVEFDLIVGRVPKSKTQLGYLLSKIRGVAKPSAKLFFGGMDKHLSKGQYDLLAQSFGPSSFLPGVKKARVWCAIADPTLKDNGAGHFTYRLDANGLSLDSLPGVFSPKSLDIGSRFFLENLHRLPASDRVLDLACGNGVLGLSYAHLHNKAIVDYVDESWQACESVRLNLNKNSLEIKSKIFHLGSLAGLDRDGYQLVLCNPPFHQTTTVGKYLALQMFKEAATVLSSDGELWVVANRHLAYHKSLKDFFKEVDTVVGNSKFVVLRAAFPK